MDNNDERDINLLFRLIFHITLGFDAINPETAFNNLSGTSQEALQLEQGEGTHQIGDVEDTAGLMASWTR